MWSGIAAVAAVIFIPVTIWGYLYSVRAQRDMDMRLDYELVSGTQLVSSEASRLTGRLQVSVDGVPIDDPYFLLIRIINTGREECWPRGLSRPTIYHTS